MALTCKPAWLVRAVISPPRDRYGRLVLHPETLLAHQRGRNLAKLGEFAGLIADGRVLEQPLAIFKGLRRPMHSEGIDNFTFVYVAKPMCTFHYERPWHRGPSRRPAPRQAVFTTFVSLTGRVLDEVHDGLTDVPDDVRGAVVGWEWTHESLGRAGLPEDYKTRYKSAIWIAP